MLLYRGIVPPIITTGVVQAINFPIYEYFKALYFREFKYDYYTCAFLGGATSGSIISTFTIPFSFVKVDILAHSLIYSFTHSLCICTQVQQQISTTNNVYQTAKNMYNLYGIRIFYRGFPCSYICETVGRGVYLFTYEYIKHYFYKQSPDSNDKPVSVKIIGTHSLTIHLFTTILTHSFEAASSAGCISWLSIYPFDCVRARLQLDAGKLLYKNTIDCFQKVYKEGIQSLLTH